MVSEFNTAAEREASPIGALYPYLQHRKPECTESCACGARDAIKAVEQEIGAHRTAADGLAGLVQAARTALDGSHTDFGRALLAMWAGLDDYQKARGQAPAPAEASEP